MVTHGTCKWEDVGVPKNVISFYDKKLAHMIDQGKLELKMMGFKNPSGPDVLRYYIKGFMQVGVKAKKKRNTKDDFTFYL